MSISMGDSNLLRLPAELRLQIYSYLLHDTQPPSVARALRQTCRLINEELKYEVRKLFDRQIAELDKKNPLVLVQWSEFEYHVTVGINFKRLAKYQKTRPGDSLEVQVDRMKKKLLDKILPQILKDLPTITAYLTVQIQRNVELSGPFLEVCVKGTDSWLLDHAMRKQEDLAAGKIDLNGYQVVCDSPMVLMPVMGLFGFAVTVPWVNMTGFGFGLKKDGERVSWIATMPSRCHWLRLSNGIFRNVLGSFGTKYHGFKYKRGCSK
ncbi:hypothetical protein E8E13_001008 [Curvularia kusanoi]|uniref:Uncharacterized protein n=1 Tax=Curvularia kusanoi TaxID=90978 RepID=A0A9P4T2K7_CURKU|nr:hypothetical protein E8E13_001008 [Curvularia kusanoi]